MQQGYNQVMSTAPEFMESSTLVYSTLSELHKQQQAEAQCCAFSLRIEENKLNFDRNEMVTDTCAASKKTMKCLLLKKERSQQCRQADKHNDRESRKSKKESLTPDNKKRSRRALRKQSRPSQCGREKH